MEANEKKIMSVMKKEGQPMRPGDIASAAGLEKDDVSKAIKKLKTAGTIHSPKRCFYEPV